MIARFFLIVLACFFAEVKAQNQPVPDSLMRKDFDYLFELIEHENTSPQDQSLYLRAFLIKAKTENNWAELSNAFKNYVYYASDDLKLAYSDSMVVAAKNSKDNKIIGSAYLSKGIAYHRQKKLTEAMDLYIIADKYILKANNPDLEYKTKYQIGQIKYYLGYYEEAISIFKECINYYKTTNVRAHLNSLHLLGLCYNMIGDHALCTAINEQGIADGRRRGNLEMAPYFLHSEGVNQSAIHNYSVGIKTIESALPQIKSNNDFANEAVGYFYIGKNYWGLGKKEKAILYFKLVDNIFTKYDYIRPDLREGYEIMISYYKEKNIPRTQLHYIERLLQIDKKLHDTYTYLQGKVRKEYDTKQLMIEKTNLEMSLQRRKYNDSIFLTIITVITFFLAYLIIVYFRSRAQHRKKYEELLKKIEASSQIKVVANEEQNLQMSKDAEYTVLQSLKKFENGMKYLDKDISLTKLAVNFKTNTKYLSQIISRHRNKNFPEYINDLKVEYIAEKIKSEKILQNYTHEALAEEAGFSSTRRFVKAFFANTGITLSYYIEEMRKDEQKST